MIKRINFNISRYDLCQRFHEYNRIIPSYIRLRIWDRNEPVRKFRITHITLNRINEEIINGLNL